MDGAMGFSLILVVTKLNEYYDGDEDLDFGFPFNVDSDQISRITPEDMPSQNEDQIVQLASTVEMSTPQKPERHAVLSPNGPEYEQARSALEYNEKELAWDLYHYQKVNLELMQRKEESVRAASGVLATAIAKSIDERLSRCHDLYCLKSWIEATIDAEVALLALDEDYGHRTEACENLIQRLARILTEQEINQMRNKEAPELDFTVLDGLLQSSGTPKGTFEGLKERSEDKLQPEPMPEWLNDLMISYSTEAKDLALSIQEAEKNWTQDSMYKTLKLATTQSPYSPYNPKECHVHAVLFEVRRGIHHEQ
jgi:hypothetical protein